MSSLLRLGRKQKNSSNPFRIRIFLFLSYVYSFGIDTINTFMHPRSSFENHTWFQTKMGENPARWGDTYLYSLYKGVTHPVNVWRKSRGNQFWFELARGSSYRGFELSGVNCMVVSWRYERSSGFHLCLSCKNWTSRVCFKELQELSLENNKL